jgi:hypothetical protein
MLRKGAEWLNRKLKQHAGETLVYSRGAHSVEITAPPGKTLLSMNDDLGGVRVEWTDADFLIEAIDLVLNGSQVEPERGDLIRWTTGGRTVVYEVTAPQNEPPWRWSDGYRLTYRVHAKEIGVE